MMDLEGITPVEQEPIELGEELEVLSVRETSSLSWIIELKHRFANELSELKRTAPHLYVQIQRLFAEHPTHEALKVRFSSVEVEQDKARYEERYTWLKIREFQSRFEELEQFTRYINRVKFTADKRFFLKKNTRIASREERRRTFEIELLKRLDREIALRQACAVREARADTLNTLMELLRQWRRTLKLLRALSLQPLGRRGGYDLSEGLLHAHDLTLLQKFAELADSPGVRTLLEELGRLRESEKELEEVALSKVEHRDEIKTVHYLKEEIIGTAIGGDLHNALASELALLNHLNGEGEGREEDELLELLLFSRMLDHTLTQYEFAGREKTRIEETKQSKQKRKKPSKSGPFIICVDTSGSMSGLPEQVAKTLAFVLLRAALSQGRSCFLINFSTQIQTHDLSDTTRSLDSLLQFLRLSFNGGTDATPALEEALRQLQVEAFKRADVVMVSDFAMPNLPQHLTERIMTQKEEGTRFHSAVVSAQKHTSPLGIFDTEWCFEAGWGGLIQSSLLQR